jgi:dTMP kinase
MPGLLVTLEGPEGAGKSTQLGLLREAYADRDPLVVREPGGTALGEAVRGLVLHTDGVTIGAEAEMYLFMAARAQLIAERIRPALEAGRMVLADRYHDSTLVYQGEVGGVPASWPASFPRPDVTVLLRVPAELGLRRQVRAGKAADRLESLPLAFHRRVAAAYERLAEREPDRFLVVDGTLPAEAVRDAIVARIQRRLAGAVR